MKKIILQLSFVALLFAGCQNIEFDGKFSIEPLKPELNESILVKFVADETKLSKSNSVDIILYQYDVDLLSTTEIAMKKEGNGWTVEFTPEADAKGIIITFKNEDIVENNNSNGFVVYLNDKDGNPLPEAIAGHDVALSQWGTWHLELESDNESTRIKFEETFKKFPEVKAPYLDFYLYTLSRVGTEEAMSKLAEELVQINNNELTEEGVVVLAKYLIMTDKKDQIEKYDKIILEKYPKNKYAATIANRLMLGADSPDELKTGFIKFMKDYPNSDLLKVSSYRVIRKYIDANDIEGAIETAEEFKDITHPFAFVYSTNKLHTDNNTNAALRIALIGVEASKNNSINPKSIKPNYLTKSAWDEDRESYYAEMLKITASIQNDLGNKSEAFKLAEEAQLLFKGEDIELNELYSSLLVELGHFKKGMLVIEKYLSENKGSNTMLKYLETAYIEINGGVAGYEEYASKFSAAGEAKLLEKLKGEMIDEPVPDFELKDINGNRVKFSDYKGKIVIVDFWATWCGPCKRSFPAMQEANDKYNDNPNVEFLFINSWERVENKLENAKKFIDENGYNLTVLMDSKNKVISKFKVTGIPTKFIIGPDQNIKFKSVGFAGTNEELVQELSVMISLLNN